MPRREQRPPGSAILWVAALLVMLSAAFWQRQTGPTHPQQGEVEIAGQSVPYRLLRSGTSGEPLRVTVGAAPEVTATMRWRHYPTEEQFQGTTMLRDGDVLVGLLPTQPPAGKLEYQLVLAGPFGLARIPAEEPVVMRFKAPVPAWALVPHILIIFLAMLVGVRTGLAAAFGRPEMRRLAQITLAGITVGGMILGPVVQKYAFGAFWTGWPFGYDLTDNKTLVMFLAWLVAVLVVATAPARKDRFARTVVILATVVMIAVYLVPHSLRGSQLDYEKLNAGQSSEEAISTGR